MKQFPILLLFLVIASCIHGSKLFRSSSVLPTQLKLNSFSSILSLRAGANKNNKIETNLTKKSSSDKPNSPSKTKAKAKSHKKSKKPEPEEVIESLTSGEDDDEDETGLEFKTISLPNLHIVDMVKEYYQKTPPITKIYLLSSMAVTMLSFVLNNNQWPEFLHFAWFPILGKFQFWRLFTGFIYLGQLDFFFPLTIQFIWQHMSQLEKMNYNHPEEFLLMTLFGGVSLITLYTLLGVSTRMLGHNLATYFVYIWARMFEGMDVNFMDIFTLKAELLPWFFCAQTYLLDQELPVADVLGIVAGHVYHYLKQKQILICPVVIKEWFASENVKQLYAQFRDNFV